MTLITANKNKKQKDQNSQLSCSPQKNNIELTCRPVWFTKKREKKKGREERESYNDISEIVLQ